MNAPYRYRRRVEFRDTDAAGIVHFSVFFNYMEEAEHALLRSLDFSVLSLDEKGPLSWPRVAAQCDYTAPLRFGEEFTIDVHVARMGRTSVTYAFDFRRDATEIAHAQVVVVCCRLAPDRPAPIPIPEALAQKLRAGCRLSRPMAELVAESLTKEFTVRAGSLAVLRGVSLTLRSGESLAVLGPSGSGKSTLLSILGALDAPTSGSVRLDGEAPRALHEAQLAAWRQKHVGFVFQEHYLLGACTALENVLVPLLAAGRPRADDVARGRQLLDRVGLAARMDHRPAELSGGEKQRVALARALIGRPTLLLADEPTGNLDRATARDVGRLLAELQEQEQMILIIATHSPDLAGLMQSQRELQEGRLA